MKYRLAIVGNECTQAIKEYLTRFCAETGERMEAKQFVSAEEFIFGYKSDFDVVLLDTAMKGMDGLQAAEALRKTDSSVIIEFMADAVQYAVKGYSVNAFGFMLKPLRYFVFKQEMLRCIDKLREERGKSMVISYGDGLRRIPLREILYIESMNHKVYVITSKERYGVCNTISNMEKALRGQGFSRCNNCYLVNLLHVDGAEGNMAFVQSHRLQISRPRRRAFMEDMAAFFSV